MSFEPSPKQAMFLWRMICAEDTALREPTLTIVGTRLSRKERQPLIDQGFLEQEARGRAVHLILTEKAWAWAGERTDVALLKSTSKDGATALESLLRRLVPFLKTHQFGLGDLFVGGGSPSTAPEQSAKVDGAAVQTVKDGAGAQSTSPHPELDTRIQRACRKLIEGQPSKHVRLSVLRQRLSDVQRSELDSALLRLQEQGRIALYRDDNSAAVTEEDRQAALLVGDAPRHLLYLKD